jgi:hypothetical protein
MIGSSLYFIALLATSEVEISDNPSFADLSCEVLTKEEASDFGKASSDTTNDTANQTTTDITIVDETSESIESIKQEEIRSITITNGIEPSMLSYKHWTGTYSPDVFTVYINDTTLEPGQTYTLADSKTPVVIRFDYSFMNGMRKGTKTTTYIMNDQATSATLTFSWLDTHKTLLDNATLTPEGASKCT